MTILPSRRQVLSLAGVAAVSAVLPREVLAAAEHRKIPIALELYSVRKELPKDFVGVIEQVGRMGYKGVEFAGYYGWDQKPRELRKLLDDNGLKCCGRRKTTSPGVRALAEKQQLPLETGRFEFERASSCR